MALSKGNMGAEIQSAGEQSYTDEQQRDIKRALIIQKLRRYWRLFCLVMFVLSALAAVGNWILNGQSLIGGLIYAALCWGLVYALVLVLFLYIMAGLAIKAFLYFRDLIGSKGTRL